MSTRDATTILAAFRSGDLRPEDYAEQVLARAEATRVLNALTDPDPVLRFCCKDLSPLSCFSNRLCARWRAQRTAEMGRVQA